MVASESATLAGQPDLLPTPLAVRQRLAVEADPPDGEERGVITSGGIYRLPRTMFRRVSDVGLGSYMRQGLEPMAERLGLDMQEAFFEAPVIPERRVLDAYRCGQSLLMNFTYPEGWPNAYASQRQSRKMARRASKVVNAGVVDVRGASAVSFMTQGYAHETAEFWRRAANKSDDSIEGAQLRESAARSDALGELAAEHWPVSDPYGAVDLIGLGERHRVVDIDNPDLQFDLRSYFGRARVACGAASIALGSVVKEYMQLIYAPVRSLDMEFAVGLQHDWLFQSEIWQNLMSDWPRPYMEFMRSQ